MRRIVARMINRITIVRHGETDHNVKKYAQGWSDAGDLNAHGVEQSKQLGKSLVNEVFTRVYSSDLSRCQNTAKHVLAQLKAGGAPIVLDKRLRERDYGTYNDGPVRDLFKLAEELNLANAMDVVPPGGESSEEAKARIVNFFEDLLCSLDESEREDENVLVVTHSFPQLYLLDYFHAKREMYDLENFEYEQFKGPCNTAVTKLEVGPQRGANKNGKRRIKFCCIFDSSHLNIKVDSNHAEYTSAFKSHAKMNNDTKI